MLLKLEAHRSANGIINSSKGQDSPFAKLNIEVMVICNDVNVICQETEPLMEYLDGDMYTDVLFPDSAVIELM